MRVSFEDSVFDSGTREVSKAGRPLELSPKAFQLLEVLIEKRPDAVSKQDLHERLWPGVFVSDASLANLVAELRDAFGDDSRDPRIIRTVHRFGYALRAVVEPAPPRGAAAPSTRIQCRLIWDGREIPLQPGENLLGREPEAAVWIDDSSVSRRHARVVVGADGATLEDLASKNGTKLQGKKISGTAPLSDRDVIAVGPASLVFRVYRQTGSTDTAIDEDEE